MQPSPVWQFKTHKASKSLKGLKNFTIIAAETCVRMGDATPAATLAELRAVLALLTDRWRGRSRAEVLQMAVTPVSK